MVQESDKTVIRPKMTPEERAARLKELQELQADDPDEENPEEEEVIKPKRKTAEKIVPPVDLNAEGMQFTTGGGGSRGNSPPPPFAKSGKSSGDYEEVTKRFVYLGLILILIVSVGFSYVMSMNNVSKKDFTANVGGMAATIGTMQTVSDKFTTQIASLNASLTKAQGDLTNVQNNLSTYAKNSELSAYAKTSELSGYATTANIATLNGQIDTINKQLTTATSDLNSLRTDVANLKNGASTYATQTSVNTINTTIATIQKNVTDLTKSVADLTTTVNAIKIPDIKPLQDSIKSLQDSMTGVNAGITGLAKSIVDIQTSLNNDEANISALQTKVATLQTQVANLITPTTTTATTTTSTGTVTASIIPNAFTGNTFMSFNAMSANTTVSQPFTFSINNGTNKQITKVQLIIPIQILNASNQAISLPTDITVSLISSGTSVTWTQQNTGLASVIGFINNIPTGLFADLGIITQNVGNANYTLTLNITTANTPITSQFYLVPTVKVISYS